MTAECIIHGAVADGVPSNARHRPHRRSGPTRRHLVPPSAAAPAWAQHVIATHDVADFLVADLLNAVSSNVITAAR
jgi:hypothetical protein